VTRYLLALALLGCNPHTPDKCSDDYLDELTARETAELIMACRNVPRDAPCADAKPIQAKYASLREDWARCP